MKFSYSWIRDFATGLPQAEKAAELIHTHAFEVTDLVRKGEDWVLDIDILPNRLPDASSHKGIAQELCAIMGKSQALKSSRVDMKQMGRRAADTVKIKIEAPKACSRYAARIIEGVKVRPSPLWLKKRLAAVGVGSINNIVDATNYVMLELGQPLHAFDLDKIAARNGAKKEIIVRFAKAGEKILTLDGDTVDLPSAVLVIADAEKALAIAGIKGGADCAIDRHTKTIAIESATFDAKTVYKASRRLGIRSDAAVRFGAGRVVEQAIPALERAASLIQQVAGGVVLWGAADVGVRSSARRAIPLDLSYASRLLGMNVERKDAIRILQALRCRVEQTSKMVRVFPAPERIDLEREEDLVEELGRILGYARIARHAPRLLTAPVHVPDLERLQDKAQDALTAIGFWGVERYSFQSGQNLKMLGFDLAAHRELLNPPSSAFQYLRAHISPGLLISFGKEPGAQRIFEFGAVFPKNKNERRTLGCMIREPVAQSPLHKRSPSFFEMKGSLEELFHALGIADISWEPLRVVPPFLHKTRSAGIVISGTVVGILGEISPRLKKRFGEGIALAEIDFDALTELSLGEHEFRQPSAYPEAVRDIAVLVPREIPTDEAAQVMGEAGGILVRDIDLFDYYEGEELPKDTKSFAFHIFYQAQDRTLTDEEISIAHGRIEGALRKRGWEVR